MVKSLPSCTANHLYKSLRRSWYKSPANHFRSIKEKTWSAHSFKTPQIDKINELNTSKALIKYGSHQEERQWSKLLHKWKCGKWWQEVEPIQPEFRISCAWSDFLSTYQVWVGPIWCPSTVLSPFLCVDINTRKAKRNT
jgi:hypothetical protein